MLRLPQRPSPRVINVDQNKSYPRAVEELKEEGGLSIASQLRQCIFCNTTISHKRKSRACDPASLLWRFDYGLAASLAANEGCSSLDSSLDLQAASDCLVVLLALATRFDIRFDYHTYPYSIRMLTINIARRRHTLGFEADGCRSPVQARTGRRINHAPEIFHACKKPGANPASLFSELSALVSPVCPAFSVIVSTRQPDNYNLEHTHSSFIQELRFPITDAKIGKVFHADPHADSAPIGTPCAEKIFASNIHRNSAT